MCVVFVGWVCLEISSRLSLYSCLQQATGHQLYLWGTAAVEVPQGVCSQVGQQQFRVAVQQVEHVLCQSLHWGVAHLIQVKNVLQKVQHLVLKEIVMSKYIKTYIWTLISLDTQTMDKILNWCSPCFCTYVEYQLSLIWSSPCICTY